MTTLETVKELKDLNDKINDPDLEEALGILPHKIKRPNKGNRITTSVGTFDSIADAAEHFGIESVVLAVDVS